MRPLPFAAGSRHRFRPIRKRTAPDKCNIEWLEILSFVDVRHFSIFKCINNFKQASLFFIVKPFLNAVGIFRYTAGADIEANGQQRFFETGSFLGISLKQSRVGGKLAERFQNFRRGPLFKESGYELNSVF